MLLYYSNRDLHADNNLTHYQILGVLVGILVELS